LAATSLQRDILQLKGSVFTGIAVDSPADNIRLSHTSNTVSSSNISGTGLTLTTDPENSKLAEIDFSDLTSAQSVTIAGLTLTATGNITAADVAAAFANLGAGATSGNAVANGSWTGSLASGYSTRSDTDSNIAASEFASFDSSTRTSYLIPGDANPIAITGDTDLSSEYRVQESIRLALASNSSASLFYDTSTGKLYYDADGDVITGNSNFMSYIHVATFQGTPSLSYMDFSVI